MKVAVVQVGYGDEESLAERVERVCGLVAAQRGHDLVILPELWAMTGFDYRRWEDLAEPLDGSVVTAMAAAAVDAGVLLHAGSIVERLATPGPLGKTLANTSVVIGPSGETLAVYRKIHRFGFAAGEPQLMEAGDVDVFVDLPAPSAGPGASAGPAGGSGAAGSSGTPGAAGSSGAPGAAGSSGAPVSLVRRAALSTCYDLRFPELYRRQLDAGAQVFLVPAAWPAARIEHWSLLGRARAVENQCVLIACNTAGTHAGYEMGGRSQVVSARGEVLAEAGRTETVLSVEVDLDDVDAYRAQFPVLADRRI